MFFPFTSDWCTSQELLLIMKLQQLVYSTLPEGYSWCPYKTIQSIYSQFSWRQMDYTNVLILRVFTRSRTHLTIAFYKLLLMIQIHLRISCLCKLLWKTFFKNKSIFYFTLQKVERTLNKAKQLCCASVSDLSNR